MTRTRFCDSAGLHALIGAHRRARTEGRQVRLAVTGPQVHRLFALAALDRLVPGLPGLDQVLAHLPVAPAGPPVTRVVSSRRAQAAGLTEHAVPGSGRRIRRLCAIVLRWPSWRGYEQTKHIVTLTSRSASAVASPVPGQVP